jgi:hypothetical protein
LVIIFKKINVYIPLVGYYFQKNNLLTSEVNVIDTSQGINFCKTIGEKHYNNESLWVINTLSIYI